MKISIMQPYFMPYAGYFRLMAASDLFVVYDCVQFPRRGWVHRNKLTHRNGHPEWLTLPLVKAERDSTRIMDLQFPENAQSEWEARLGEFPALDGNSPFLSQLRALGKKPRDYIVKMLQLACGMMNIDCRFAYSSALDLPEEMRAQERILAIARHFGATHYVNAPGGRELYDADAFAKAGIALHFLPDYKGGFTSMAERLAKESAEDIAKEICQNL